MKLIATIILLGMPILCGACATASLPLSTRNEADPVAATYNRQGMERYQQGQWLAAKEHFEEAIRADPDRIAQALANIIVNAIDAVEMRMTSPGADQRLAQQDPRLRRIAEALPHALGDRHRAEPVVGTAAQGDQLPMRRAEVGSQAGREAQPALGGRALRGRQPRRAPRRPPGDGAAGPMPGSSEGVHGC